MLRPRVRQGVSAVSASSLRCNLTCLSDTCRYCLLCSTTRTKRKAYYAVPDSKLCDLVTGFRCLG